MPGEHVTVTTTGPGRAGVVTDGGGTYTATITATHTGGKVEIAATDDSVKPSISATTTLKTKKPAAKKKHQKKKKKKHRRKKKRKGKKS